MKCTSLSTLTGAGFALLLCAPSLALAQAYLGSNLRPFAVLGGSTVTNVVALGTVVTGDLGVSPGSAISGFGGGVGQVIGTIYAPPDAPPAAAQNDLTAAFSTLTNLLPCADMTGIDLGGQTLKQGVYCFSTSAQLTGTLRLDAENNPDASWVFRIGSTLTTAPGSSVVFINGSDANSCGVQWRVGTSATIDTTTRMKGNVLAQASITMNNGASLIGRALARTAAVTLDNNTISFLACRAGGGGGAGPGIPPTAVPTLPRWVLIALVALLGLAGLAAMRKRVA